MEGGNTRSRLGQALWGEAQEGVRVVRVSAPAPGAFSVLDQLLDELRVGNGNSAHPPWQPVRDAIFLQGRRRIA